MSEAQSQTDTYYPKMQIEQYLKQIESLQNKLENLSRAQLETVQLLEIEQLQKAELSMQLQQQDKHYQEKVYSQMVLLNEKAQE